MIAFLRGTLLEKGTDHAVVEAAGVGYEVFLRPTAAAALSPGEPIELFICESVPMYGGGTTLYGFTSREEKEMFLAFKDNVQGTGAKKALEYLERAAKSLPDFRRAVLEEDLRILTGVFGFTKKTAEKIAASLKDKLGKAHFAGAERLQPAAAPAGPMAHALEALAALGYKPAEARTALDSVSAELAGRGAEVGEIVRLALRRL
jgi:Holliday junction DNA helicase RuvA